MYPPQCITLPPSGKESNLNLYLSHQSALKCLKTRLSQIFAHFSGHSDRGSNFLLNKSLFYSWKICTAIGKPRKVCRIDPQVRTKHAVLTTNRDFAKFGSLNDLIREIRFLKVFFVCLLKFNLSVKF